MLAWFENLTPGEKCSACAVIDDKTFLTFYVALVRAELKQEKDPKNGGINHAYFTKAYLTSLHEAARDRKNIDNVDIEYTSEYPILPAKNDIEDSSLMSFLIAEDLGTELSDNEFDPFSLTITSPPSGTRTKLNNSQRISPLHSVVDNGNRDIDLRIKHSHERSIGLQSAVDSLVSKAVVNVTAKLTKNKTVPSNQPFGNDQSIISEGSSSLASSISHNDTNCGTSMLLSSQRNVKSTSSIPIPSPQMLISNIDSNEIKNVSMLHSNPFESDPFELSRHLHGMIATSFATNGTYILDCLFLLRTAFDEPEWLMKTMKVLEIFTYSHL